MQIEVLRVFERVAYVFLYGAYRSLDVGPHRVEGITRSSINDDARACACASTLPGATQVPGTRRSRGKVCAKS